MRVLQIALKCADICNPCRPWKISKRWSRLVCEEFFQQGDITLQQSLGRSILLAVCRSVRLSVTVCTKAFKNATATDPTNDSANRRISGYTKKLLKDRHIKLLLAIISLVRA